MNAQILEAVDTYNPITDVVFLLEFGSQVSFFSLKNLPIKPPECYAYICKEWEEFPPQSTLLKNSIQQ